MSERDGKYRIDEFIVDFSRRRVFDVDGDVVSMSALSFAALATLVEASPAVVSPDELVERAWNGAAVSDETVTQRIRLLRKALGDKGPSFDYIETVRSSGYRLIPPVTEVPPAAVRSRRPRLFLLAAGVSAILVGLITWWYPRDREPAPAGDVAATMSFGPVTAAQLAGNARSLSDQRNEASLGHAIELYEEALLQAPHDREIRSSLSLALSRWVAWYGHEMEIAKRAEALARSALADGSFFAGEAALGFALDAQGKMEPAREAYERAVALDPDHYGARASLAYLLQEKGKLVESLSHNVIAYRHAPPGTLDVQLASCLRLLGFSAVASEWLERADRLDPDSAHAAPMRALDLISRGRIDEAYAVIRDALARGINQLELYEYQIVLALIGGDIETAGAIVDSIPASISHRGPANMWGRTVDALAGLRVEQAALLVADLESEMEEGETWPGTLLYIAQLQAAAGRSEEAIEALQRLFAAGYRDHLWLDVLPTLGSVRGDPRFRELISIMRDDVDAQRLTVLTADWLPDEIRQAANGKASR